MDILGVGPLELIFVLIIALIVLGPTDMVKAGRTIGKFLRQIVTSPTWHAVTKTSSELRNLPTKLIRDAGLEEDFKDIQDAAKKAIPSSANQDLSKWQEDIDSWTNPPTIGTQPIDDTSQDIKPEQASTQSQDSSSNIDSNEANQPEDNNPQSVDPQENQEQAD